MKPITIVLCIFITLITVPVSGEEFYRYIDKHGNVLYTDDLSKVPPDQRDQVTSYEQSESPAVTPQETATPQLRDAQAPAETDVQEKERNRLESAGKALDQELEQLMKERKELDEEKSQAVTNAQIKSYNDKIVDFNKRIKAFEEKRASYAEEVNAFNQQVEKNIPKNDKKEQKQ